MESLKKLQDMLIKIKWLHSYNTLKLQREYINEIELNPVITI